MIIGLEVIRKEIRGVTGDAGIGWNNAGPSDNGMACGAANQGDGGDGAVMACCAGVVIFDVIGVDQKCR